MKSAPPHSFGRVTYALAALVFTGFALASLQGASCLSIDQNVCVAADGSGDCNGDGTPGTRTAQTVPDEVFESPFDEDDTCESQYDCYEGNELDQCLRPACVAGRCVAVVNSFQACTPYGLWCAIGECMPMPNTSIYPAYCSFNPNFEEYTGGPQIVPNSCLLGQQCYAGGDANPLDACQVCEPDENPGPGLWAPKQCDEGTVCVDGECVEPESEEESTASDSTTDTDTTDTDTSGTSTDTDTDTDTSGTSGTDTDTVGTSTGTTTDTDTTDADTDTTDADTGTTTDTDTSDTTDSDTGTTTDTDTTATTTTDGGEGGQP
jgi:hypothetical protein